MTNTLNPIIAQHIAAVNAFDTNAIVSTFADDAFVNDAHREFRGIDLRAYYQYGAEISREE